MKLELLAPARNKEIAKSSILHGADAVYMGGPSFGARSAATNSVQDIAEVVKYAHGYHAKVYATLNTIVYEDEFDAVKKLVNQYYEAGVDALIVQDMALIGMRPELPPIALHASTQCDIRSSEKALMLALAGFEQLVLPRELTLEEISEIRKAIPEDVVLEGFVHGALCVSYSGDCQAGFVATGRSANRGECPQMCRLPYELVDSKGKILAPPAHYLSLRDLNRLVNLEEMIAAGITSFKIEGRLKDESYVKNVVAAYSEALNRIVAASNGRFERESIGHVHLGFVPDVNRTFNRGYTSYFLHKPQKSSLKMASLASPKWVGQPVGRVLGVSGSTLKVELHEKLSNGDGLTFIDRSGEIQGFRLNKIDGNTLYPAAKVDISAGSILYRNLDKDFINGLEKDKTKRVIPVSIELSEGQSQDEIVLSIKGPKGVAIEVKRVLEPQEALKPQEEQRARVLGKLGDTRYEVENIRDFVGPRFIPASILADFRREAIDALDNEFLRKADSRQKGTKKPSLSGLVPKNIDRHSNVSNSLSEKFYRERGAEQIEKAIEVQKQEGESQVMECRYCLRRELGQCMREKSTFPKGDLFLRSVAGTPVRYRLSFDCANCKMRVWSKP